MILYEYTYSSFYNKVEVRKLEVEEKPKTYVVKKGSHSCYRNISKDELGIIHTGYYSKPMYLLEKDFNKYKQALVELKTREVRLAENALTRAKKELEKVEAIKEGE